MKFVVSSKTLSSHLQAIGRVILSKNSLVILDNFLFEVNDGQLVLTASDGETTLISTLELVENEGEGRFSIKSKKILEALKDIPEQPLTFEVNNETLEMTITYMNGKYNLYAQDAEAFPLPMAMGEATTLTLPAEKLLKAIDYTLFASSVGSIHAVMNGIYFDITTDGLTIVATDGHKLVRFRDFTNKALDMNTSFILPRKPAQMLKNIYSKESGEVVVAFDGKNATFTADGVKMICRLIEGRFPKYNAVIPTNNPYTLSVDRHGLLGALRRVLVFASESDTLVKIQLNNNEITLSGQDLGYSTSAEEHLNCSYNGNKMEIGFKGSFLLEMLNNLPGSEITIELADATRPGLLIPNEQQEDEDLLMLLMPMMLKD